MRVCKVCGQDFTEEIVSGDICPVCLRDMTMTGLSYTTDNLTLPVGDDWISVEDELPEYGRQVIAYWWGGAPFHDYIILRRVCGDERDAKGNGEVKVIWLDDEGYCGDGDGYPVTHWKYLLPPDCRNDEFIENMKEIIVRVGWDPDHYPTKLLPEFFSELLFINGLDAMCIQTDVWLEDLFEAFPVDNGPETYDEFSEYMLSNVNRG